MNMRLTCTLLVLLVNGLVLPSAAIVPRRPSVDLDQCNTCKQPLPGCDSRNCRCDVECEFYGDCCESYNDTSTALDVEAPTFQCRSAYLDSTVPVGEREAFWMVSACPEEWSEDATSTDIADVCTSRNSLPPVTDMNTGLVYGNEYCAICNGVENIIPWNFRLECSGDLYNRLRDPNFVLTQEILDFECQPCRFIEPRVFNLTSTGLPAQPARTCFPHTTSCMNKEELEMITRSRWAEGAYNKLLQQCTDGLFSLVSSSSSKVFRNQYCAICNGVNMRDLQCADIPAYAGECYLNPTSSPPEYESGSGEEGEYSVSRFSIPFSLVLDVKGDGEIVATSGTITQTITVTCPEGEVFDPIDNTCRKTLCLEGFGGTCEFILGNDDTDQTTGNSNQTTGNSTTGNSNQTNGNSQTTVQCSGQFIQLNETEYEYVDNSTIRYGDEEFNFVSLNSKGQVIICTNFSMNGTVEVNVTILYYTYPTGYLALTYIGCSLSVLGCALLLLTYSIFKELRTLPSKILMNLATTILISNVFILFGDLGSTDYCTAVAIILHMFFLAQFGWMSIMTFEMGRIFISANKLAPKSSERFQTKLFVAYLLIGWGIPLTITTASVAINFTLDGLILYGELEDGTQGSCWINHLESVVVVFITPLALSLLFTGIVFTIVTVLVCSAWQTQAKLEKTQTVHYLRVYIAICSTTGLTWVFGFPAILTGEGWAWYPFILLNSTQGFLIFLAFICTKKIGKLYLSLIWREPAVPSTKQSRAQLHSDEPSAISHDQKNTTSTSQV